MCLPSRVQHFSFHQQEEAHKLLSVKRCKSVVYQTPYFVAEKRCRDPQVVEQNTRNHRCINLEVIKKDIFFQFRGCDVKYWYYLPVDN